MVSAADPVDRDTGRLVHLPDAPFLIGALDPVAVLAPHVAGPVTVDNDVNWAARAERELRAPDDFAYLFLGEGLGCAIVTGGEVTRGRTGLAGEIAHLVTTGPHGRAMPFIDVFGGLGLRRPDSTAIDLRRLLELRRAGEQPPEPMPRAARWARPSAGSSPPWWPSPTWNSLSSADHGAPIRSFSTRLPRPSPACPGTCVGAAEADG